MADHEVSDDKFEIDATIKMQDSSGSTKTIRIDQAKLMDQFFIQRDLSSISDKPFFSIATVEWGYGFIEQVNGQDSVKDIPTDSLGLDTVLAENVPARSYPNNIITLRCVLPAGTVTKGSVYYFSALNVKDGKGNSIIKAVVLPIPVTSERLLQFDLEIRKIPAGA